MTKIFIKLYFTKLKVVLRGNGKVKRLPRLIGKRENGEEDTLKVNI